MAKGAGAGVSYGMVNACVMERWVARRVLWGVLAGAWLAGVKLSAQHQHGAHGAAGTMPPAAATAGANSRGGHPATHAPAGAVAFGGIPHTREASGTAWQPDGTPMHAHMMEPFAGGWRPMVHYNIFATYDHQSGPRGDDQVNSINWLMLMASRANADNELLLRGMFSLEPWTTTGRGYPLLFQSGEAYHGEPLVDRQHPHDLFMEVAARYRRALADNTVASLHVAPAGEPA